MLGEKQKQANNSKTTLEKTFHDLPPQPEPDDKTTPYQYFKMFVTDELLDMVKEQTNLYSAQSTGSSINVTAKDSE